MIAHELFKLGAQHGFMEVPSRNPDLPALAAVGIIAMMVLFSIAIYLLLGNQ